MKRLGLLLLFLSALIALGQLAWHVTALPAQVASHFNAAGEADGFMDKSSYALFMIGLFVGMPLFLLMIGRLARSLPTSMINIPNRDYWLHPDRREQTLGETESMLIWIALASEIFFMGLAQLTFIANVRHQNLSGLWFGVLMTLYLVFVLGLTGYAIWRYRLPRKAA